MNETPFPTTDITVTKYATRHWAVWLSGELVAVTVYLKGARRVAELLQDHPVNGIDDGSETLHTVF